MSAKESGASFILQIPECLRCHFGKDDIISYDVSLSERFAHYKKAAHVFIWSRWEGHSCFGRTRAAVMMQMRFDGTLGFSGGLIDKNEGLIEGLVRELKEEINWDSKEHPITWNDYHSTKVIKHKHLIFNFFIKEIPYKAFVELEKRALSAADYGSEVLGIMRVPLYTMIDGCGGLPTFLNNSFVGEAKYQLLLALHHIKILTDDEIEEVLKKSKWLHNKDLNH